MNVLRNGVPRASFRRWIHESSVPRQLDRLRLAALFHAVAAAFRAACRPSSGRGWRTEVSETFNKRDMRQIGVADDGEILRHPDALIVHASKMPMATLSLKQNTASGRGSKCQNPGESLDPPSSVGARLEEYSRLGQDAVANQRRGVARVPQPIGGDGQRTADPGDSPAPRRRSNARPPTRRRLHPRC